MNTPSLFGGLKASRLCGLFLAALRVVRTQQRCQARTRRRGGRIRRGISAWLDFGDRPVFAAVALRPDQVLRVGGYFVCCAANPALFRLDRASGGSARLTPY
jgi:hypothetical protein